MTILSIKGLILFKFIVKKKSGIDDVKEFF